MVLQFINKLNLHKYYIKSTNLILNSKIKTKIYLNSE